MASYHTYWTFSTNSTLKFYSPNWVLMCSLFTTQQKTLSLSPSLSLSLSLPQRPFSSLWVGSGLLRSVKTPISRTRRPADGHSQSFGVRNGEVWASLEQILQRGGRDPQLDPGVLTQYSHFLNRSSCLHICSFCFVHGTALAKSGWGFC